jgi:uncharacterized protein (TIGR02453 family)
MYCFSPKSLALLNGIKDNNNRRWFQEHREEIEEHLLAPARDLVLQVGEILIPKFPGLIADPRTDKSIYRLYRDTRFSRDKRPYKDWLALTWYLDTPFGRLDSPCFYFHLTEDSFLWSVGCYRFCPPALDKWAKYVLDKKKGPLLEKIESDLINKKLSICPPQRKRLPAGADKNAPRVNYLLFRGFYTWSDPEAKIPRDLFSPKAGEFLGKLLLSGRALFDWLTDLYRGLPLPLDRQDPVGPLF